MKHDFKSLVPNVNQLNEILWPVELLGHQTDAPRDRDGIDHDNTISPLGDQG